MYNIVDCVDYSSATKIYFTQPKSWVFWAILGLHDYISYFLINVLIVVLVFAAYCIITQERVFEDEPDNPCYTDYYLAYAYHEEEKHTLWPYAENKVEEFCHAPKLEFFWTVIPLIMLSFMGWPSFKVLYAIDQLIDPLHCVIVLGNQWYWTYAYNDYDVVSDLLLQIDSRDYLENLKSIYIKNYVKDDALLDTNIRKTFENKDFLQLLSKKFRNFEESKIFYDCVIIADEDLPKGYPRLLSTDQVVILPSHTSVRLSISSNDVIHSWALPSHGIKMDAVPGRLNQVNFLTSFWGTYWGQCSELCGINHGFMPIEVRVVPLTDYYDFIRLNISYRMDKFVPMIGHILNLYLVYLDNKSIEKRFCFLYDYIL